MRGELEIGGEGTMRVVLADSDAAARRRVRDALQRDEMIIVAEATSGREAIELATFYAPDAVVLDAGTGDPDALEALRLIHERAPAACVVLLTDSPSDNHGLRALRAGAAGYLAKDVDPDVLPRIVRGAVEGEVAISRRLATALVQEYRKRHSVRAGFRPVRSTLTDREWEVLDLVTAGARTDEIARALVLSTETVRSHLKNLYRKLGVRSRGEAAEAARRMREMVS